MVAATRVPQEESLKLGRFESIIETAGLPRQVPPANQ